MSAPPDCEHCNSKTIKHAEKQYTQYHHGDCPIWYITLDEKP